MKLSSFFSVVIFIATGYDFVCSQEVDLDSGVVKTRTAQCDQDTLYKLYNTLKGLAKDDVNKIYCQSKYDELMNLWQNNATMDKLCKVGEELRNCALNSKFQYSSDKMYAIVGYSMCCSDCGRAKNARSVNFNCYDWLTEPECDTILGAEPKANEILSAITAVLKKDQEQQSGQFLIDLADKLCLLLNKVDAVLQLTDEFKEIAKKLSEM